MHNVKCDMLCHMSHSTVPHHISLNHHNSGLYTNMQTRANAYTHKRTLSENNMNNWAFDTIVTWWWWNVSLSVCVFNGDTKFLCRFCWFAHFSNQSMLTNSFIFINAQYQFLDFYQFSHRPHHNIPTYQYTAYTMRIHTRRHNTNLSRLSYRMTEYTNSRTNAEQVHIFEQPEIKMIKLW